MAKSILLIDDDRTILAYLSRLLERAGYEVETADCGETGRALLEEKQYALVIVDLYLPDIDGFEILEWLREKSPDAVALILSGSTDFADAIGAMQSGAFDFITKPIDKNDMFLEQVRRAIVHKELQDSNTRLVEEVRQKNQELENRLGQLQVAHSVLQSQAMAVQADLKRAQAVQRGLLPRLLPFHEHISLSVFYQPANKVGGDFYDVFELNDEHLGIYIADTAGHGVSSALITMFLKYIVHPWKEDKYIRSLLAPGDVLRELNELVFSQPFGHDLFVSMTYAVLNIKTGLLQYSHAGHPPIQLRHKNGQVEPLRSPAPALGINAEVKYSTATKNIEPNDVLVFHTDGVTDVQDIHGIYYGRKRLCDTIAKTNGCDVYTTVRKIERDIEAFSGAAVFPDDTTIFALGFMAQETDEILPPPEVDTPSVTIVELAPGISCAQEDGCTYLSIAGAGTWRQAKCFMDTCHAAQERHDRQVVLDLAHCKHLDSTFMGVLHTICLESDENASGHFRMQLQNVPRNLLREMSELGLTTVLLHFRSKPKKLPDNMETVKGESLHEKEMGRLLLGAHEALVHADPKNADRFAAVLKLLQEQAERQVQS